jgi:hypothetical protein
VDEDGYYIILGRKYIKTVHCIFIYVFHFIFMSEIMHETLFNLGFNDASFLSFLFFFFFFFFFFFVN